MDPAALDSVGSASGSSVPSLRPALYSISRTEGAVQHLCTSCISALHDKPVSKCFWVHIKLDVQIFQESVPTSIRTSPVLKLNCFLNCLIAAVSLTELEWAFQLWLHVQPVMLSSDYCQELNRVGGDTELPVLSVVIQFYHPIFCDWRQNKCH